MTRIKMAAAVALVASFPLLAACSTTSASTTSAPTASSSATNTTVTSADDGTTVAVTVGQHVTIADLPAADTADGIIVTSTDPSVAAPIQGPHLTTNLGFTIVGKGTADINVYSGNTDTTPVEHFTVTTN